MCCILHHQHLSQRKKKAGIFSCETSGVHNFIGMFSCVMLHKVFARKYRERLGRNKRSSGSSRTGEEFLSDQRHFVFGVVPRVHEGIVAFNTPGDYFWDGNARAGRPGSRPRLQGVCSTEHYWESGSRGVSQRSRIPRTTGRNPSPMPSVVSQMLFLS